MHWQRLLPTTLIAINLNIFCCQCKQFAVNAVREETWYTLNGVEVYCQRCAANVAAVEVVEAD